MKKNTDPVRVITDNLLELASKSDGQQLMEFFENYNSRNDWKQGLPASVVTIIEEYGARQLYRDRLLIKLQGNYNQAVHNTKRAIQEQKNWEDKVQNEISQTSGFRGWWLEYKLDHLDAVMGPRSVEQRAKEELDPVLARYAAESLSDYKILQKELAMEIEVMRSFLEKPENTISQKDTPHEQETTVEENLAVISLEVDEADELHDFNHDDGVVVEVCEECGKMFTKSQKSWEHNCSPEQE